MAVVTKRIRFIPSVLRLAVRQPLLEALAYPDRRVQYEASLTLARALPPTAFNGDYRVVPLLASAVRTGAAAFVVVASVFVFTFRNGGERPPTESASV